MDESNPNQDAAPVSSEGAPPDTGSAPAAVEETKPTVVKAKPTPAKRKGRKAVKKKPDDMPRRPLSAYNFFFSEMRSKLLEDRAAGAESEFQKFLDERQEQDGEKKNGFFSNMGKYVAKRWKELTPDELQPFTEKAEKDLQRYRKEMDEYREGVARKTRLASEQKLRDQEAEAAKGPPMGQNPQGMAQPWMMGANPMMGFQNPTDPSFQLFLRQQLLQQAQNPQLNAFLLQQQFGGPGGMGFNPMGQFPQQQQQQQGMPPSGNGQPPQGGGGDMASSSSTGGQGGPPQQQPSGQFDMQNQQDLLNNLQQQQSRMQGMYPMMPGQFGGGMPMNMMGGGGGMPGQDNTGGGMDQPQPGMPMLPPQQQQPGQQPPPQQAPQQQPPPGQPQGSPNAAATGGGGGGPW